MTMLALTELTLSHFRSHKAARLSVEPGLIAIHGANGAGKTNILEAVSLMSPGRGLRRASAEAMVRKPEALGWKIRSEMRSLHQMHEIETFSEEGTSRQVRIDGKAATQVALGQIARVLWLIPSMDRLWIEGADGRRRFLDRMTLSFEPRHAEATLTYEKAMRERNRLLKDQVRDVAWYSALELQMAKAGARIHANRRECVSQLLAAQGTSQTAFPTADLVLTQAEAEMPDGEDALLEALQSNRTRDLAAGRTLIGPHRADLDATYAAKQVAAKDCSTGEQKALLVSLILANGRALAEGFGAPPILLLDEVAAHLDPDRRAALYDEISALGAQAWMTGTEPALFDTIKGRAMFFEVSDENGSSVVKGM